VPRGYLYALPIPLIGNQHPADRESTFGSRTARQPTWIVRLSSLLVLLLSLLAACKPDVPPTNTSSGIGADKQGSPSRDSAYLTALAGNIPRDDKTELPVTLAANDETDVSNYQSSGWSLGRENTSKPARFSADFVRFTSGVLILKLDTTLVRNRTEPPFDSKLVDSLAVRGLGKTERFATDCRFGTQPADERLTGLVPDSTPDRWMQARLAWLLDTASARIRRIRPDSISCMLSQEPD